jgi:hypothetical protein
MTHKWNPRNPYKDVPDDLPPADPGFDALLTIAVSDAPVPERIAALEKRLGGVYDKEIAAMIKVLRHEEQKGLGLPWE